MNPDNPKYWFPAKKYGWGWGPPTSWQGWLVMFIWFVLLISGAFVIMPATAVFIAYTIFMALILSLICLLKGEPPRWRSSKD